MASRTGVPSLIGLARQMCLFIVRFSPVIRLAYPNATSLHAALAAAMAACEVLQSELIEVREFGD